jgi:short-subunit dehydrogenase
VAVVVITGASSGIGEATARLLAEKGHQLVLAARRADRLDALALALAPKTDVLVVQTDVADPAQVEALVAKAVARFGTVDVLVNNAGMGHAFPWWEETPEGIVQTLNVNVAAPMLAARAVIPLMREKGRGHIINVASVAGHIATTGLYAATKFALRGHSEALRRELAPLGIAVSVVSPGFIRTEMTEGLRMKMPGPEIVAQAIERLVRRPRREVVVPGYYRLLIWLCWTMPWLADLILARKDPQRGRSRLGRG